MDAGAVLNNPSVLYKTVTEIDATNSTAEVDLFTYTVPANTLSTNNIIRLVLLGSFENNTSSPTVIVKLKYGTTIMYQDTTAALAAAVPKGGWAFIGNFHAINSTSVQGIEGWFSYSSRATATTGFGDLAAAGGIHTTLGGTAAEASTTTLDLKLSVTWSAAAASSHWRLISGTAELLD